MRKIALMVMISLLVCVPVVAEKNVSVGVGGINEMIGYSHPEGTEAYRSSGLSFSLDYFGTSSDDPMGFLADVTYAMIKNVHLDFGDSTNDFAGDYSSVVVSTMLGFGYVIGQQKPFSVIIGAGPAIEMSMVYQTGGRFVGFGASATARYKFTPLLGVTVGVRDEFYPIEIGHSLDPLLYNNSLNVSGAFNLSF